MHERGNALKQKKTVSCSSIVFTIIIFMIIITIIIEDTITTYSYSEAGQVLTVTKCDGLCASVETGGSLVKRPSYSGSIT